jgi:hypothetical protein
MIFKYLFIAFLIIVFVPPVRRFVFYLLVGRQLVKEQKQTTRKQRAGDVRVENPANRPKSSFNGGDYVNYEEIK